MGIFTHVSDVTKARVTGISIAKNVVVGVVTVLPMRLVRGLLSARSLFEWPFGRMGAAAWAMAPCHARSAATTRTQRSAGRTSRFHG